MKNNIIVLIILSALLSACDDRIIRIETTDLPTADSKLVLAAFLYPDSIVKIQVNRTAHLDESYYLPSGTYAISNATVSLYEDSLWVEDLAYVDKGYYHSATAFIPRANHSYYFVVEAPGYEMAYNRAEKIPADVPITGWSYDDSIGVYEPLAYDSPFEFEGQKVGRLVYYFDDPPSKNYYSLNANTILTDSSPPVLLYFNDILGCEPKGYPASIEDICFNGSETQVVTDVIPYQAFSFSSQDSVQVILTTISESYYKFAISSEAYLIQADGVFEAPFSPYNNIINGYGLVAAANKSSITICLK